MSDAASLTEISRTVTTAGTPVVLGAASIESRTFTFQGTKAAKTRNVDDVYIRQAGGAGWLILEPGGKLTVTSVDLRPFNAAQFEIDAAVNGDGVYCVLQNLP